MLSKLLDPLSEKVLNIKDDQIEKIRSRLLDEFETSINERFSLFETLYNLFELSENNLELPIEELKDFKTNFIQGSEYNKLLTNLRELNENFENQVYDLTTCFEGEKLLTKFLRHFQFFVNYKMASVKEIGYHEMPNSHCHYLHRYTSLGINSKAQLDVENIDFTPHAISTDSVILYKGNNYYNHINLYPFVIDYNALIFEKGSRICVYNSRVMNDPDTLNYLFLDNHEIKPIERRMELNADIKLKDVMIKKENHKTYNLDSVIIQFNKLIDSFLNKQIQF